MHTIAYFWLHIVVLFSMLNYFCEEQRYLASCEPCEDRECQQVGMGQAP